MSDLDLVERLHLMFPRSVFSERADRMEAAAEITRLRAEVARLREALARADDFITNGIAFGFIRMPDAGTPDPAHETPGIVRAALAGEAAR